MDFNENHLPENNTVTSSDSTDLSPSNPPKPKKAFNPIVLLSILCFFLAIALAFTSVITILRHHSSENIVTVTLTKDNYDKYLAFNVTYSDVFIIDTPGSSYDSDKTKICYMTITTHAQMDNIVFENGMIEYGQPEKKLTSYGYNWNPLTSNLVDKFTSEIATDGFSQVTIALYSHIAYNQFPSSRIDDINITNISGKVLITETK